MSSTPEDVSETVSIVASHHSPHIFFTLKKGSWTIASQRIAVEELTLRWDGCRWRIVSLYTATSE